MITPSDEGKGKAGSERLFSSHSQPSDAFDWLSPVRKNEEFLADTIESPISPLATQTNALRQKPRKEVQKLVDKLWQLRGLCLEVAELIEQEERKNGNANRIGLDRTGRTNIRNNCAGDL